MQRTCMQRTLVALGDISGVICRLHAEGDQLPRLLVRHLHRADEPAQPGIAVLVLPQSRPGTDE